MAGIIKRLQLVGTASAPRLEGEAGDTAAGREAEDTFTSHLKGKAGVHVFHGVRVPDPACGRRREIDAVVLTRTALLCIEVKNWSGEVRRQGGQWVQHRREGRGIISHPDVLAETQAKARCLEAYVMGQAGLAVPKGFVQPKVVLLNKNVVLDKSISSLPEVYTAGTWKDACTSGTGWAAAAAGWVRGRQLSSGDLQRCLVALRGAPTWDEVHKAGGRVIHGDFVCVQPVPGACQDLMGLLRRPGEGGRKGAVAGAARVVVDISHNRSYVLGALGAVLGQVGCIILEKRSKTPVKLPC